MCTTTTSSNNNSIFRTRVDVSLWHVRCAPNNDDDDAEGREDVVGGGGGIGAVPFVGEDIKLREGVKPSRQWFVGKGERKTSRQQ